MWVRKLKLAFLVKLAIKILRIDNDVKLMQNILAPWILVHLSSSYAVGTYSYPRMCVCLYKCRSQIITR